MSATLANLFLICGIGQLSVLVASALVPFRLRWAEQFRSLPRLHRQMIWVYGGYVVLAILALGTVCIVHANELAMGGGLARSLCAFGAIFWGIRLSLQLVLDVKPYLTTWWLKAGYHLLSVWFAAFMLIYLFGAWHAGAK